jgi:hypothetical protein
LRALLNIRRCCNTVHKLHTPKTALFPRFSTSAVASFFHCCINASFTHMYFSTNPTDNRSQHAHLPSNPSQTFPNRIFLSPQGSNLPQPSWAIKFIVCLQGHAANC